MAPKKKQYLFGNWNLALLAFVVIIFAFFTTKSIQKTQVVSQVPKITVSVSPMTTTLARNKQATFAVFVGGTSVKDAIASDIKLSFDKNYFKVISVKPGGFYSKPMIVKFNYQTNSYSLALSPAEKDSVIDPTKPILSVVVLPLKENLGPVKFTVGADSQIYLTSTKNSTFPSVSGSNVTINAK